MRSPSATASAASNTSGTTAIPISTAVSEPKPATEVRSVKNRASIACSCCRQRKVRCDVAKYGNPCTNCRLEDAQCVIAQSKRRRKYRGGWVEPKDLLTVSPVDTDNYSLSFQSIHDAGVLPDHSDPFVHTDNEFEAGNNELHFEDPEEPHFLHSLYQQQNANNDNFNLAGDLTCSKEMPCRSSFSTEPIPPKPRLPSYLQPVPTRLASEDVEYLERKGAFTMPTINTRNELLRCYVQHVHPYLPILDLRDFMTAIWKNNSSSRDNISLLLFQAVLFAATPYIDLRFLTAEGFSSRRAARKAYFGRVRVLCDLGYEDDRLSSLQAVLLMTYWHETPRDPKDVSHWLGVAVSLLYTMGLNRNPTTIPSTSAKQQRLYKRIWWSCYVRDRLIGLVLHRPIRIHNAHFDVPMLELQDFETEALPAPLMNMLAGCSSVSKSSVRQTMAIMCIQLAKLCTCLTEVIAVRYAFSDQQSFPIYDLSAAAPQGMNPDPSDILRCDRSLERWFKDLPRDLKSFRLSPRDEIETCNGKLVYIHKTMLLGIYLTAISTLYRPQSLSQNTGCSFAPELRDLSRRKVREAANTILGSYQDLHAHDLVRLLPNTGVTCLLSPIIANLADLKSHDSIIRQASLGRLRQCRRALQSLRLLYGSADVALLVLETSVRKANVRIVPSSASTRPYPSPDSSCDYPRMQSFVAPASHKPTTTSPPTHVAPHFTLASSERMNNTAPCSGDERAVTGQQKDAAAIDRSLCDMPSYEQDDRAMTGVLDSYARSWQDMELDTFVHSYDAALLDNARGGVDGDLQWLNGLDLTTDGTTSSNGGSHHGGDYSS